MWEIYHKKFSDNKYKYTVLGVVMDEEENVISFVQKLNDANHSYWAWAEDGDEDCYGYKKFKTTTIEDLSRRALWL